MDKYQATQADTHHPEQHGNTACGQSIFYLVTCIVAVAILVIPRFIHLDADPVPGFIPGDVGYQIDEGYKTFAPKNLLIFGKQIWHPDDTYGGWMNSSPVTQWPYYYAFKHLGLELKNARLVTVLYSALFLMIACYIFLKRYSPTVVITGMLLLASETALFYFSRSALFETAVILFVYTGILLTARIPDDKPVRAIAVLLVFMLLTTLLVKRSAMVYLLPPIMAVSFYALFGQRQNIIRNIPYMAVIAAVVVSLAFIMRESWLSHLNPDAILYSPKTLLLNPMPDLSPLALFLGYSCILHILLVKPEHIYNNLYRLSLVAVVVGGPIILSLFVKHPPRYFVAIVPACLLLTLEWVHLRAWKLPAKDTFTLLQKIAIFTVFIIFSMMLMRASEILGLRNLPFTIGEDPGIDKSMLLKLLPIPVIGLYLVYRMNRVFTVRALGLAIPLFATVSIATGIYGQSSFLLRPSYDSQIIRSELNEILHQDESVAGDWAAFFTAEAPLRSFYMSRGINFPYPDHIEKIRPDYFLSSNTSHDIKSLDALNKNEIIKLGEPRDIGSYMGHTVSIYPVNY